MCRIPGHEYSVQCVVYLDTVSDLVLSAIACWCTPVHEVLYVNVVFDRQDRRTQKKRG